MAIAVFNPTNLQMTQWESEIKTLYPGDSVVNSVGMSGNSPNSPIYDLVHFRGMPGHKFRCPLVRPDSGEGVTDNTRLTGTEGQPVLSYTEITQKLRRRGFQAPGEFEQKKSNMDFGRLFVQQMQGWAANIKDYDFFASIKSDLVYTSQNLVAYPEGRTTVGDIGAGDKLSVAQIRKASAKASVNSIGPVMIPGFGSLKGVLLITPEQSYDLLNDDEWNAIHQNAGVRGDQNALFRMGRFYKGIIDNVLIIECAALAGAYPSSKLGGSHLYTVSADSFNKAEAIFLGASAVGLVDEYDFKTITPDDKDWGDEIGHGGKTFMGFAKNVIDMATDPTVGHAQELRDFATVYVPTAATNLAA